MKKTNIDEGLFLLDMYNTSLVHRVTLEKISNRNYFADGVTRRNIPLEVAIRLYRLGWHTAPRWNGEFYFGFKHGE